MTCLQVVKALDKQIDASFKRSASNPVEVRLRADIRSVQVLLRQAHNSRVITKRIQEATEDVIKYLSSEDGLAIRRILKGYTEQGV